jgi:hypothetical protein
MAYGIEDIAKMQVTGPVQGGDMVMKPDQAPVGAAALLNKMQNKNTPGIFKLPMPDKQMPDFMKVAAEGVEQQTAKGDTINQMAGELIRQGIDTRGLGMDEIIKIYEETFGSPGDVDQFGISKVDPSDWRTILQMINSGMSSEEIDAQIAAAKFPGNFTDKKQNVVELPRNLKTGPDNPETELAYITDDEKALLAFMKPGTPHVGPENVPTYDEGDYLEDIGYSRQEIDRQQERAPTIDTSTREGQQQRQDFRDRTGSDVITDRELEGRGIERDSAAFDRLIAAPAGGYEDLVDIDMSLGGESGGGGGEINQEAESFFKANKDKITSALGDFKGDVKDLFITAWNTTGGKVKNMFTGDSKKGSTDGEEETDAEKDWKEYVKKIGIGGITLAPMLGLSAGKEIGKMLHDFKVTPEKLRDENYLAIMKDTLKGDRLKEFEKKHAAKIAEAYGEGEEGGGFRDALASAVAPEGSEAQRRTDPEAYYKQPGRDPEGKFFQPVSSRFANTMGNLEDIASIDVSTIDDPDFKQRIFDARAVVAKERDAADKRTGKGRRYGGGSDLIEEKLEEIVSTTPTDPRAGKFNVGGTMPYTDAIRTAGVETDVPLGRRFQVDKEGKYRGSSGMDLSEAMKYATLGGYGQLEPFQEYLTRRRKHLGEDKPQWFDEEGNVIYSETA